MGMKTFRSVVCACVLALFSGTLCAQHSDAPRVIQVDGDVEFTHDPSIAKDGGRWYLFSTNNGPERKGELPVRCSKDLHHWERCGYVFQSIPDWIKQESPRTRELWAPDISYFDGEFHLYYAFSLFGKKHIGNRAGYQQDAESIEPRVSLGGSWPGVALACGGQL